MEIKVADQRILLFNTEISSKDATQKAWQKKMVSFDALSKMTSFLSRPKDEDFELVYEEHRYQPFWHVVAKARYVYDRSTKYQVNANGNEVRGITLQKTNYEVTNGHFHLDVVEHCTQEEQNEVLVDGVTGAVQTNLSQYLTLSPTVVKGKLEKLIPKNSILVPPQARISGIMRDSLSKMIKGIQADTILEEQVEVTCVDLYYRPIYEFQFRWKSKNKDAIVEVDGVTGEIASGHRTFNEYLGKVLDQNFLFDVGADAAGLLIPGGSIAVKVAKRYIDNKKSK
jgi:hypothetical protein